MRTSLVSIMSVLLVSGHAYAGPDTVAPKPKTPQSVLHIVNYDAKELAPPVRDAKYDAKDLVPFPTYTYECASRFDGWCVGAFGGVAFGNTSGTRDTILGTSFHAGGSDLVLPVTGINAAYTWHGWMISPEIGFKPSLEAQAFWMGGHDEDTGVGVDLNHPCTRVIGTPNEHSETDDSYVFMLNPIMRLQLGCHIDLYAGGGIGAAYCSDSRDITGSVKIPCYCKPQAFDFSLGQSSGFEFAYQGFVGCEVFIARDWSLDARTTYLVVGHKEYEMGTLGLTYHFGEGGEAPTGSEAP